MFSVLTKRPWRRFNVFVAGWCACLVFGAGGFVFAADATKETVADWLKQLESGTPFDKEKAIMALATVTVAEEQDNDVVKRLVNFLSKPNTMFVREDIIKTLGKLQLNAALGGKPKTNYREPFIAILKDTRENALLRRAVVLVFKDTLNLDPIKPDLADKDKAYPIILEVAKDKKEKPVLRKVCIDAIGELAGDEGIALLSDLLNETDQDIKEAAAIAFNNVLKKDKGAELRLATINILCGILKDKNFGVDLKVAVMKALARLIQRGNLGAKNGALSIIMAAPKDRLGYPGVEGDQIVLAAVESMGIIGTADVVGPLRATYTDYYDDKAPDKKEDVPVRKAVVVALGGVLMGQGDPAVKSPDLRAVHSVAEQLIWTVEKDGNNELKGAAIYWMKYFYPPAFKGELREIIKTLLGVLKAERIQEDLKDKAVVALFPITERDWPKEDWRKWYDWFDKTFK